MTDVPARRYTSGIQDIVAQVQERNRLRRDAGLPLVSVAKEVRTIVEAKRKAAFEADFEHFIRTTIYKEQFEEELFAAERLARGDLNWRPSGMLSGGGLLFRRALRKRLLEAYRQMRR